MIWKNFVSRPAVTSRRRGLATATFYGLSLAVRFTSATGEEVEIPPHAAPVSQPLVSVMRRDGTSLPYQDWGLKAAQPIVFRRDWPNAAPAPRCFTP